MKQFLFFCTILFMSVLFDKSKFYAKAEPHKKIISWYSQIYSKENPPQIFVQDEEDEDEEEGIMSSTTEDSILIDSSNILINSEDGHRDENEKRINDNFTNDKYGNFDIKNDTELQIKIIKDGRIGKDGWVKNNRNEQHENVVDEQNVKKAFNENLVKDDSFDSIYCDSNQNSSKVKLDYESVNNTGIKQTKNLQNYISSPNHKSYIPKFKNNSSMLPFVDSQLINLEVKNIGVSNFENNDIKNYKPAIKYSDKTNFIKSKNNVKSYCTGNSLANMSAYYSKNDLPVGGKYSRCTKTEKDFKKFDPKIRNLVSFKNILREHNEFFKRIKRTNLNQLDTDVFLRTSDNLTNNSQFVQSVDLNKFFPLNLTNINEENLIKNEINKLQRINVVKNYNTSLNENGCELLPNACENPNIVSKDKNLLLPDIINYTTEIPDKGNITKDSLRSVTVFLANTEEEKYQAGLLKSDKMNSFVKERVRHTVPKVIAELIDRNISISNRKDLIFTKAFENKVVTEKYQRATKSKVCINNLPRILSELILPQARMKEDDKIETLRCKTTSFEVPQNNKNEPTIANDIDIKELMSLINTSRAHQQYIHEIPSEIKEMVTVKVPKSDSQKSIDFFKNNNVQVASEQPVSYMEQTNDKKPGNNLLSPNTEIDNNNEQKNVIHHGVNKKQLTVVKGTSNLMHRNASLDRKNVSNVKHVEDLNHFKNETHSNLDDFVHVNYILKNKQDEDENFQNVNNFYVFNKDALDIVQNNLRNHTRNGTSTYEKLRNNVQFKETTDKNLQPNKMIKEKISDEKLQKNKASNLTGIEENFLQLLQNIKTSRGSKKGNHLKKSDLEGRILSATHPTVGTNLAFTTNGITRIKIFGFVYEADGNSTKNDSFVQGQGSDMCTSKESDEINTSLSNVISSVKLNSGPTSKFSEFYSTIEMPKTFSSSLSSYSSKKMAKGAKNTKKSNTIQLSHNDCNKNHLNHFKVPLFLGDAKETMAETSTTADLNALKEIIKLLQISGKTSSSSKIK